MGQILSKGASIEHQCSQSSQLIPIFEDSISIAASFLYYQKLPFELKLMIWEHAFEPRHVRIWGQWIPNYAPQSHDAATSRYVIRSSESNPAALSVDTETRAIALRFYKPIQFRCRLTTRDELGLLNAGDMRPGSLWWWWQRFSLVSESLAYFNKQPGDSMKIDFVSQNVHCIHLSPKSRGLDFSSPDHFQILRIKGCRHNFDRIVTSVLWPTARFRWHILGSLTTRCADSADIEAILRLKCEQERHGAGDFKVVSEAGAIRCRLCGKRLAWGIQL